METLLQIAQSQYGWLFALVVVATLAGAMATAWIAWRYGLGKWLAGCVGLAICCFQLLTFQIIRPRLLTALLSTAPATGELVVGIALLLASAPIAIPLVVLLTMRLVARAKKQ